MGAKRPPSCAKKAYVEIDIELLQSTGEIRIISAPIIAPTITTKVPRGSFEITYTSELFGILEKLGNKKIQVLSFILDHKDGNNTLNMTNTELAERTKISRKTVVETINILRDADLLQRKGSVIMISPNLMVKGNQLREAWLMRKYEEIHDNEEYETDNAIDVTVESQLRFIQDGTIVQRAR